MATAELLLHPVRLRIVQAFLGEAQLTTGELRARLPAIPVATLYRQVGTLVEGEVLEMVAERKVRGTFERTYRLRMSNVDVSDREAAAMDTEGHRQAFMAFVASLLLDFDRYLARGEPDLARDGVGYRQAAVYLTDAELPEFVAELAMALAPWIARPAAPGRSRRLLSAILMPT